MLQELAEDVPCEGAATTCIAESEEPSEGAETICIAETEESSEGSVIATSIQLQCQATQNCSETLVHPETITDGNANS